MAKIDLARWRPHLRAARAAGISLARYAREHGMSRHTLYAALRTERDAKAVDTGGKTLKRRSRALRAAPAAAFVPVAVARSGGRVAVRLSNGVVLECAELDAALLATLVAALAALPCSV